ncbi:hypothetical protein [Micromonospora sp. SH-82]|uniref:hypothetical protein n=1 Tax=Micromonospora sp. SH-82 TaxID=3132938 RepID=UPI003EBEF459
MLPAGRRSAASRVVAHVVLFGWHGLVIIVYLALLDRQSSMRESWGNAPKEDMMIFGFQVGVPMLLGSLLVGLVLLRRLMAGNRINSAVVLGTVAAAPVLLCVAVLAGQA